MYGVAGFSGLADSPEASCIWSNVVLEDVGGVGAESHLSTRGLREVANLDVPGPELVGTLLHTLDPNVKGFTNRELSIVQDAGF